MSNKEQVEAEARKLAHEYADNTEETGFREPALVNQAIGYEAGFIAGRTVTAEQVEAAARGMFVYDRDGLDAWAQTTGFDHLSTKIAREYRESAYAALTAAGLIVEFNQ